MKQTTFTLLLSVLLSMVGLHAYASDIEVDGIYYNFNANTKTAEVTFKGKEYYYYNNELLNFVYILHNIIFAVMAFQIITILFYLYTYNSVLAEIINSLIAKFDVIYDNENDFKTMYIHKISINGNLIIG